MTESPMKSAYKKVRGEFLATPVGEIWGKVGYFWNKFLEFHQAEKNIRKINVLTKNFGQVDERLTSDMREAKHVQIHPHPGPEDDEEITRPNIDEDETILRVTNLSNLAKIITLMHLSHDLNPNFINAYEFKAGLQLTNLDYIDDTGRRHTIWYVDPKGGKIGIYSYEVTPNVNGMVIYNEALDPERQYPERLQAGEVIKYMRDPNGLLTIRSENTRIIQVPTPLNIVIRKSR